MASKSSQSHDLLPKLRASGDYTDLLIRCGEAEFKVHKCIVCPQSSFFKSACEKERWVEGRSGVIELKAASAECPDIAEDDPRAVKLMIDYLYLRDYDPTTSSQGECLHTAENHIAPANSECVAEAAPAESYIDEDDAAFPDPVLVSDEDPWGRWNTILPEPAPAPAPMSETGDAKLSFLEMHAKMYVIASKYDIGSLEELAFKKFKCHAKQDWSTPDLIATIPIIFGQTAETKTKIRKSLKNLIVRHSRALVQAPGFEEAVNNVEGLAYELFRLKASSIG